MKPKSKSTSTPDRVKNTKSVSIIEQITPEITKITAPIITDTISLTQATDLLSKLNNYAKALEADRKAITAPIKASIKAIEAKYAPAEDKLEEMITSIRKSMSIYQTKLLAEQQAKEQAIADRVEKGTLKMETGLKKMEALPTITKKVATDSGSISFTTQKKFEVTDPSLLPKEYILPNETAIRNALKANIELPGCRYWTEQVPINRR